MQAEIISNLFETTVIDDRVFERKSWVEIPASSFIQDTPQQPRQLIFSTLNCKDLYILPYEGYIEIDIKFRRNDEGEFKNTDRYALRNHVLSLFENIEIQVSDNDNKIEELRFSEHWANIIHLLKWSEEYAHAFGPEVLFARDAAGFNRTLGVDVTADSFNPAKESCNIGLLQRSNFIVGDKLIATLYLKDLPFLFVFEVIVQYGLKVDLN